MNATTGRFLFAAGESHPDLLYATGIPTPDPFLWFHLPGTAPAAVLHPLEIGRGRKLAKPGLTILSEHEAREQFELAGELPATAVNLLTAMARRHGLTGWETSANCPLRLARALELAGLGVEPVLPFFLNARSKVPPRSPPFVTGCASRNAGWPPPWPCSGLPLSARTAGWNWPASP